jgi:hypothetical protein
VAPLVFASAAAPAQGHRGHRRHHHTKSSTFAGSCQLSGTVRFIPPLTNAPQPARDIAVARGTCSGTLTTPRHTSTLNNSPTRYYATDFSQTASCNASPGATGQGKLKFPGGTIGFQLSETRASGAAELSLTGNHGGSAQGTATISSSANPVQIVQECAGTGLPSAPVDISIQTTPAISG